MRLFSILIIFFLSGFFTSAAVASKSSECNVQLHMFNKLNKKTTRTFSGKVNYTFSGDTKAVNLIHQRLIRLKGDLCTPEVSGSTIKLPDFISTQLSVKTEYVGTLFFSTGHYDVRQSEMRSIKNKINLSRGLLIVGRASTPGTKLANRQLSKRRAEEVANYFSGITSATIIALGDEQSREELGNPLHDNRRVDVYRLL